MSLGSLYDPREDESYPERLRVDASRVEKSQQPHSWRSVRKDPAFTTMAAHRWVCARCGGWVDAIGVRPSPHLSPTCNQLLVDNVHNL